MALSHNPRIVTKGLVLALDAANPKSYPGSGTTWFDMSKNKNDATLILAPIFNVNRFSFDGTQTATVLNPLGQSTLTQEWTVSAWINITDKVSQRLVTGLAAGLSVCYTQGNNSLLYLNSGANDYYTYGGDLGGLGWVMATFRFRNSDGYRTIYRNTTNISTSGPNNTSIPVGQSATFTLCSALEGDVAQINMYDRVLTDAEIQQNFEATRSRFGI
jgi:hypothetical protein